MREKHVIFFNLQSVNCFLLVGGPSIGVVCLLDRPPMLRDPIRVGVDQGPRSAGTLHSSNVPKSRRWLPGRRSFGVLRFPYERRIVHEMELRPVTIIQE